GIFPKMYIGLTIRNKTPNKNIIKKNAKKSLIYPPNTKKQPKRIVVKGLELEKFSTPENTVNHNQKIKLTNDGRDLSSDIGNFLFREFGEKIGFFATLMKHLNINDARQYYIHSSWFSKEAFLSWQYLLNEQGGLLGGYPTGMYGYIFRLNTIPEFG